MGAAHGGDRLDQTTGEHVKGYHRASRLYSVGQGRHRPEELNRMNCMLDHFGSSASRSGKSGGERGGEDIGSKSIQQTTTNIEFLVQRTPGRSWLAGMLCSPAEGELNYAQRGVFRQAGYNRQQNEDSRTPDMCVPLRLSSFGVRTARGCRASGEYEGAQRRT